jgi:hypothetical protein
MVKGRNPTNSLNNVNLTLDSFKSLCHSTVYTLRDGRCRKDGLVVGGGGEGGEVKSNLNAFQTSEFQP